MQTGYNELDKIIEINKGDLIIVAARPAMGKTSFVSNVANYVLNKENETVLFLGLEELKEKIEKRDDKRPLMEDFTSSPKRINYYVDKVLFIYRDSYYNKNNKSNLTEIIVANNKNGKTGTVELEWIPKYLKFVNTKLNRS